ncbi:MAG: 16S rRNA (cytosine(1402)-N(4))-methyltransferase RsmH [Candidatus Eisenbacteria bacterium]|nr:16S rRNA (cytosine(1402)-N(4))-methyltransferase RsmH [Candidatus Eisenbacteria bacterium]
MGPVHHPVMAARVVEFLVTRTDGFYVDCTVGGGGHARQVLLNAPSGRLLGIDLDEETLVTAQAALDTFGSRVTLRQGNFGSLKEIVAEEGIGQVDGVLFDLGYSSLQLDAPERGLSFSSDGPLDMRFDRAVGASALDVISRSSERDLAAIIKRFGEERRAHPIARSILQAKHDGLLETTSDLKRAVLKTKPGRKTKTLARVFQALRIAVNDELDNLRRGLEGAVDVLRPGGRIVVLSYHSLEDRIVKRFFVGSERPCTCPKDLPHCVCGRKPTLRILTKRVERPEDAEVHGNPRARSAKLRAAERLAEGEQP